MNRLTAVTLTLALLTGCSGVPATNPSATPAPSAENGEAGALRTGLALVARVDKSTDASAEKDGVAQADVTLVAVTVGEDGVIRSCAIDGIQAKVGFDDSGKLTVDPTATFPSKNELGEDYGMKKASGIGREWSEQAAAFAQYAQGKTLEELRGMTVAEDGKPAEADLAASVTISVGDFLAGLDEAVRSAVPGGAQEGDTLALTSLTDMAKSKDASPEGEGLAQVNTTAAAVTLRGETITSCAIDGVQAGVSFDASGVISSDVNRDIPTKNQLGEEYGMKKASGIGREWNEQAAAFCAYVTGKNAAEVAGLSVDGEGVTAEADLAASVTISIAPFQALVEKAAG